MPAIKLQQYLHRLGIPFEPIEHPPCDTLVETAENVGIPLGQLVRAVLLADHEGLILAVLPGDHLLNFHALTELLGRRLRPAGTEENAAIFSDCQAGCIPPFAEPYELEAVIDEQITHLDQVYVEPGRHDLLLRLDSLDFQLAHTTARWGRFARPVQALASEDDFDFVLPDGVGHKGAQELCPAHDIQRRVAEQRELPAMPETAHRLLRLHNDPKATIADLVAIVELDPSLGAQVIRYATSAYFGYHGRVDSIEQAITRVLGFETVVNMALGIASAKSFQTPKDGPIGLHAFWRHAIYSAALCQSLAGLTPRTLGVKRGMAYLAGLLHNLGFLVLGHLYKPEFHLLNKTVALNPKPPITLVERRLLGIDHTQIGARLFDAWAMPMELVVAVAEHHNENYHDEHSPYAHLVLLADQLLRGYDIGDGANEDPPPRVLTLLGMNFEDVLRVTQRVLDDVDGLDTMARQLAGGA